jgi:hypothetical protein
MKHKATTYQKISMGFFSKFSRNKHLNFVKVFETVKVKALNPNNFKKTSAKRASSCVQCGSRTDKKNNQRINGWMLDFFK